MIGPFVKMEFGVRHIACRSPVSVFVSLPQLALARMLTITAGIVLNVAKQSGSLLGAIFWPLTSDYIGRRPAFNITLGPSCVV
jgi:hypothetical protein